MITGTCPDTGPGEKLITELYGRLVFVQLIDPALEKSNYGTTDGPQLHAIDIWIGEKDNLGKGYRTAMMTKAIARCFAFPL